MKGRLQALARLSRVKWVALTLADDETFARELPIENFCVLFLRESTLDFGPAALGTEESDAAAAASAADLRGLSAVRERLFDQPLHLRRRHTRSQPLAI